MLLFVMKISAIEVIYKLLLFSCMIMPKLLSRKLRTLVRGFLTKKEKIEMLKEYKKTLEKESKGVSEKITELESEE